MLKLLKKNKLMLFLIFLFVLLFFISLNKFNFFIWFALVPLLIIIQKYSMKKVLFSSFLIGMLSFIFCFLWLKNYKDLIFLLAMFYWASFFVAFSFLNKLLLKYIKGISAILIAPIMWIILQFVYSFNTVGNFWLDFSVFQPMMAPLIWYVGSIGITFLIILMNSIISFYILKRKKIFLIFGLILGIIVISCFLYSYFVEDKGESIKVALIQGNFPESHKWRKENAKGLIYETYQNLTLSALKENPEIVIWPEYSILLDVEKDEVVFNRLSKLASENNIYLIFGAWTLNPDEDNRYDTAVIFDPEGNLVGTYNSIDPAPYESKVLKGDVLPIFNISENPFGIVLCYEELKKNIAETYSKKGAKFILALSNDQRFKKTKGIQIISMYPKLRASENRKNFVRTTNTGITQIINSKGKVVSKLEPWQRGILVGNVVLNTKDVFYDKNKNLVLFIAIVLFLVCIVIFKKT